MDQLAKSQTCDKSNSQARDYMKLENRQIFEDKHHFVHTKPQRKSNPSSPSSNKAIFEAMEVNMKDKVEQYKTCENHNEEVLSKSTFMAQ